MRFDIDANSPNAELFLNIRDFILKEIKKDGAKAREKFSENITSFFSSEFQSGFCYIRTKDDFVHLGWFKGAFIDDRYDFLSGNGKLIRAHKIKKLDKLQKDAIKYYILQTKLLHVANIEKRNMKKGFNG